jgi:hypothetical protein
MRGAGVDSVLQTVRMEGITHTAASLMIVDSDKPLRRGFLRDGFLNSEEEVFDPLRADLLRGVDLLGVFWSVRGVAVFDGVRAAAEPFVGVVVVEEGRVGVPEAEPRAERRVDIVLLVSDLSRNE